MDDFNNKVSNVILYKNQSITLDAQYDTYINANNKNKNKSYGKSELLLADES